MTEHKVLFVDDDEDDLQLVEEVLVELNWKAAIEKAYNGAQALDRLKVMQEDGGLPCLVVLDINMPVLDGKRTLAIIRETKEYKDLPVVMFTTSTSSLDKTFCNKMGVEMVTKPTSYQHLKDVIERLLSSCKI